MRLSSSTPAPLQHCIGRSPGPATTAISIALPVTQRRLPDDTVCMDPLAILFARYRGGDLDALGEVFDRTAPRLLRLAMHLVGTAADAEDLVQATFVQAMRLAERFDAERPLLPWLMALLAGQARNLLKSRRRKAAEPLPELMDDAAAPPEAAARAEVLALLRRGVTQLPAEQRQVLLLQLQHGLSPAEIADVLEVPAGTVRMRLHRGIQRLRAWLPASLAIWLSAVWPERGLAAVRGELLQLAANEIPTRVTPIAATFVMKKKITALATAMAAVLVLWWLPLPSFSASGGHSPGLAQAVTVDLEAAVDPATAPAVQPAGERSAVALREGSLQVVVRGREGDPVVDLPVFLWRYGGEGLPGAAVAVARTDPQGQVQFAGLQPGPWTAGPYNAARPVQVDTAIATLEIALVTHVLRGRVVNALGQPVAGAAIELSHSADWIGESLAGSADQMVRIAAQSDAAGRFVCAVVSEDEAEAAGEAWLAARHAEHGVSGRHLTRRGIAGEPVLVLEPFTSICSGQVVDAEGRRLGGVLVGARSMNPAKLRRSDGSWRGEPFPVLARTKADGTFRLPVTWRGPTALVAQRMGFVPATQVQPMASPAPVELVLRAARSVAGVVLRADGQPAASVAVNARAGGSFWGERTNQAGRFLFADIPAGDLALVVVDAWGRSHPQPLLAAADNASALQILLPPTLDVQGQLVGPDGAALPGFRLQLAADSAGEHRVQTGASGEFALPAATTEPLALQVFAPFAAEDAAPLAVFRVTPGEPAVLRLEAQAMPRAVVSGRVVDARGVPVGGAEVSLWAAADLDRVREFRTGPDGEFVFRHLAAAPVVLRVDAAGPARRAVLRFHAEAGNLGAVVLLPAAQLTIQLRHADGEPWRAMLPELEVQHLDEPLGVLGYHFGEGVVRCDLLPGMVRVALQQDPSVIAEPQQLQVVAGEATSLPWVLRPARRFRLQFDAADEWVRGQAEAPLQVRIVAAGSAAQEHLLRRSRFEPRRWVLETSLPFGRHQVEATRREGLVYGGEVVVDDAVERPTTVVIPRLR